MRWTRRILIVPFAAFEVPPERGDERMTPVSLDREGRVVVRIQRTTWTPEGRP